MNVTRSDNGWEYDSGAVTKIRAWNNVNEHFFPKNETCVWESLDYRDTHRFLFTRDILRKVGRFCDVVNFNARLKFRFFIQCNKFWIYDQNNQ